MRKHRPPSQIRYEKSHPVVSFRLDRELKERLEKVLEGKSFADFVKEGLGVREREKKSLEKARGEYKLEGFDAGFGRAKLAYGIYARCAVCGRRMIVEEPGLKKELARYVEEQGWGHSTCMVKREERGEREREAREAREREKRGIKREIERVVRRWERRKRRQ